LIDDYLFVLLGSLPVEAARKHANKIDHWLGGKLMPVKV